jgi:toxin ParE1/3/4
MIVKFRILSTAQEESTETFLYYESEREGLGEIFLKSLDVVFQNIRVLPLMYPVIFDDIHRALVPKFPYAVYYSFENDEATILALHNTKRKSPPNF